MQLIIISGPSGSGKTTLSKTILKKLKNGIILSTDNYYRTGLKSRILAKLVGNYFDRNISFNYQLFKKDLNFILNNGFINSYYKYDFKYKSILKTNKKSKNINFLIIEGIFGEFVLNDFLRNKCILIKLKTSKKTCMKRVIKRDYLERGKSKDIAKRDFLKAWTIFNEKKIKSKNYLKKIVIQNKDDLSNIYKEIINMPN